MVLSYVKEFWQHIEREDAFGLAAQCAYYFLLALFPLLIFIMSLLGYLPFTSQDVISLMKEYIPSEVVHGMETHIKTIVDARRGGTLSFSLVFSLVSASAAMNAIVLAVNKSYGLPERKSFIHSRLLAVLLTIGMLIVIASALLLSVFGHWIGDWMHVHVHIPMHQIELWNILRWVLNFIILFLVFLGIYYIAPNTCLSCKSVLPGSFFAAAGWQLTSLGFSYYVNHFTNYNTAYGSLGGIIVLMTWFYTSALIIMIGGVINAMGHGRRTGKSA